MIFGCGYVGRALAQRLLQAGVRVGALTRNADKAAELKALGLQEVVVADLDSDAWHDALSGTYGAVVNCVSSAGGGLAGYRRSYVEGQASILRWAQTQELSAYVYTSSTSVYPQSEGVIVDEAADLSAASESGRLLLEAENLLAAGAPQGVHWTVLRLAGIYGPQRHYILNQLRDGLQVFPGSGAHRLNLVHRDDIVEGILLGLMRRGAAGIYNLADGTPVTKQALVEWIAEQLHCPVPSFDPSQTPPRQLRRGAQVPDRVIDSQKAQGLLGWTPKFPSYREGYRDLL
ncbi:NAD-dependent epimerase/dehydratase [Coraliomargarita akajimensis DSM 45221]|uniref:NAD-dependent epimerase/dehydratase n=2 Tax=Coraliomargarita TaxID=442430 RepID=D5ELW4_CORAD|nr:NAD-dependent epimerase/dehydratase [Coraliomargarita akajimensis DSM 45221]